MTYNLEALEEHRFQRLVQALLVREYPSLQCMPVAQPDGGRDAFVQAGGQSLIFQVKFVRNPGSKDARQAVEDFVKTEGAKVQKLKDRGAERYVLATNASGTAHLDTGTIDRLDRLLSESIGITAQILWRDDIERRLEGNSDIFWRYPEVARGQDFLELLVKTGALSAPSTQMDVFRAYLSAQFARDREVRFQQVQIQNNLMDLFTDSPLGVARSSFPKGDSISIGERELAEIREHANRQGRYLDDDAEGPLAAEWLFRAAPRDNLQRVVLEGAPGQGKSTVTQFICQVHRARILNRAEVLERLPEALKSVSIRLPTKIDLRDYASWVAGDSPFDPAGTRRPSNYPESLEGFIAYQISHLSGGRAFSVDDFMSILSDSHLLIVLDGFDEVADIPTRAKLIEQIRLASERISEATNSLQVIVTSRPNAFVLSPGFPEREWLHLELKVLHRKQIFEYADKWIVAKEIAPQDADHFRYLLRDRIDREHVRSLAKNPMQLAILLNLINTKGRSLPDKRTALYESYMDLFFGREAEKDEIVRENRDILLQIHYYVAWILQSGAEKGGRGSVTQEELQGLVESFVEERGYPGDVLKLFGGVVERVGALVSRVQGTLEFEVQPLREFFAGKYLYDSAPHSPPGFEKKGAKPERFAQLAKRPYWFNVARFFSGCYSTGELPSLLFEIDDILGESNSERPEIKNHTIQLAVMLLADYVFSQQPKTVNGIVELVTRPSEFPILLASRESWEEQRLRLQRRAAERSWWRRRPPCVTTRWTWA